VGFSDSLLYCDTPFDLIKRDISYSKCVTYFNTTHQDDKFTVHFLVSKSTGILELSESNVQRSEGNILYIVQLDAGQNGVLVL